MTQTITVSCHPDYEAEKPKWEMYRDLDEGDHKTLVKPVYLWPTGLEQEPQGGAEIRAIRQQISQYTNFLASVVEAYLALYFKEDPDISSCEKLFGEYIGDVDGEQTPLIEFAKNATRNFLLFGKPFIWTNTYNLPYGTKENRPFWKVLSPLCVPDWEVANGHYSKFRIAYSKVEPRTSLIGKEPEVKDYTEYFYTDEAGNVWAEVYRKITAKTAGQTGNQDQWELVQAPMKLQGRTEIPIATLFGKESWVKDIAPEQLRHFNLSSSLDNGLYYQAHEIRYITNADPAQRVSVNSATWLFLKEGQEIGALTPSSRADLKDRLHQCEENLAKIAFNLDRQMPSNSAAGDAADSQRERKQSLVSRIKSNIHLVQTMMNRAIQQWAEAAGKPVGDAQMVFVDDLTVEDVDQQIKIFTSIKDVLSRYPTWSKEIYKKIAAQQDLENIDEIIKEIENTEIQTPDQQAAQNGAVAQGSVADNVRAIVEGKNGQNQNQSPNNAASGSA